MSEFSESYHLKSDRREDAIELLRQAKLKGNAYQPTNGWVNFLVEGGAPGVCSVGAGYPARRVRAVIASG